MKSKNIYSDLAKIEEMCQRAFKALGAKTPRKDCRYFEINKDMFCWVGLNVERRSEFIRINPFVGVHCVSVMSKVAEFSGLKYKKGQTASISVPLGILCPNVQSFVFDIDTDIESEALRLAKTVLEYGVPYAENHATIEALLPIFKEKIPQLGNNPERYLVSLGLLGRQNDAQAFIEKMKTHYQANESEDIQSRFIKFSDNFSKGAKIAQ